MSKGWWYPFLTVDIAFRCVKIKYVKKKFNVEWYVCKIIVSLSIKNETFGTMAHMK